MLLTLLREMGDGRHYDDMAGAVLGMVIIFVPVK